jgi:hypothetical protein
MRLGSSFDRPQRHTVGSIGHNLCGDPGQQQSILRAQATLRRNVIFPGLFERITLVTVHCVVPDVTM